MAESAGKITIKFDADMSALSAKLGEIETRIKELGSGAGAAGGSGNGGGRRRVQASTLGGSAPVDSVSDAPIMGAHAQAAAAGLTTPVGMPTSRLPYSVAAPGSAARGPYELAYPSSFGGYLEMAARRGVAGDDINRGDEMQANITAQRQQMEALQRQYGTTNLRGYSPSSFRGRMSQAALGFRQTGAALTNPASLLGGYFALAFGGMELQAASNAQMAGVAQQGQASTVSEALAAQSGIMASQYGGPVGSIIANASAFRYGMGFGGGQAAFGASELAGASARAGAAYQTRLGGVQSAAALESARGAQMGGMAGQLVSARAQMDAGQQARMMALNQQQGALSLAINHDPTQSVFQAMIGGAIVGGTAGGTVGGIATGGNPVGIGVGVGIGAGIGAVTAGVNTSAANSKALEEKSKNVAAMQARLQMMQVQAAQMNAAEAAQYEVLREDLGRGRASQLRGLRAATLGSNAVNPYEVFAADVAGIDAEYQDVAGERGVSKETLDAAGELRAGRTAAATRRRDYGINSLGYAKRGMAGAYAAFMGDTIGGARQQAYEAAQQKREDLIMGGMDADSAAQMAGQQYDMDFGQARMSYASNRLSSMGRSGFNQTMLRGGTSFSAQRRSIMYQGASQFAMTNDGRIQGDIAAEVEGQIGMVNRDEGIFRRDVAGGFAAREAVLNNRGNPYAPTIIGAGAAAASRIRGFNNMNEPELAKKEFGMFDRELRNMTTPYQGAQVGSPLAYAGADGGMSERAMAAARELARGALNENPNEQAAAATNEISKDLKVIVEWIKKQDGN